MQGRYIFREGFDICSTDSVVHLMRKACTTWWWSYLIAPHRSSKQSSDSCDQKTWNLVKFKECNSMMMPAMVREECMNREMHLKLNEHQSIMSWNQQHRLLSKDLLQYVHNICPQAAVATLDIIQGLRCRILKHPPYSPDRASSGYPVWAPEECFKSTKIWE